MTSTPMQGKARGVKKIQIHTTIYNKFPEQGHLVIIYDFGSDSGMHCFTALT
jgi:hypothetical protein